MQHNASARPTPPVNPPTQVFLADDSALSHRRVAEMLTAQGMVIVGQADTPESAASGILATRPDVVVLDVQLGRGTGMQVMKSVLKARPDTPFIVLSHHAETAFRTRYLAEGATRFLDKCSEFHELANAVIGLVQSRRTRTPISSPQTQES
ncbi:response regulator transcription factor [Polaromonas sp. YR568]|uniref:response regulator n=1 Tax=Polaromonas sp. YR568 TaxID=1855301 RepID=UPI003137E448